MEIAVKNFGPIKHGAIDLSKRFYVFVGHNNSGKTYMANLVWGMNELGTFSLENAIPIDINTEESKQELKISIDTFKKAVEFIETQIINKKLMDWFYTNENPIFIKTNTSFKLNYRLAYNTFKQKSFKLCHDVILPDGDNETFFLDKEENQDIITLSIKDNIVYDETLEKEYYNSNAYYTSLGYSYSKNPSYNGKFEYKILVGLIEDMIKAVLKPSGKRSIFLPANRIFYPSFYKDIYESSLNKLNSIAKEISYSKLKLERLKALSKRPYTKPMEDLLKRIYNLKVSKLSNPTYTDLLQKLRKLMGGEIVTKNAEGIGLNEFKLKMDSGEELDLYLSSSAANQLTTLYLYLKYWASDSNNFLIMDEPEENLHPKHQIALLDILMQFANRNNNRVLITTHSSLLAESVNNHIQIGKLQDLGEDVEKIVRENNLNISLNDNLRPNDFGVYFFGNGTITPYDVDDYGVFFRDFKQEEDKVAEIAEVLTDRIYKLKKAQKSNAKREISIS